MRQVRMQGLGGMRAARHQFQRIVYLEYGLA